MAQGLRGERGYITPAVAGQLVRSAGKDFSYTYPFGLDLKPGAKLHQQLADELLERAIGSEGVMSQRYDSWNAIDNLCRAYVTPEDVALYERGTRDEEDQTKGPFVITLPHIFANKEALLTYLAGVFLVDDYFQYEGVGPEDVVGALLMQHLVQQQCVRCGAEANFHIQ